MSRLLKVEGTLFIEVDSRWSLDTLWMMLDYFLLHKLGFYTSRNDVNKIIFSSILKDIIVDYPYGEYEGFQDKNYMKCQKKYNKIHHHQTILGFVL